MEVKLQYIICTCTILFLAQLPSYSQEVYLESQVKYEEINESDQEFLEHQDSHARKLEDIDLELLVKDARKILHVDSVKIRRKDISVNFEDAWFRANNYFENGTRHSEWLYNMNIRGVKDSIKIFVGHYECYQGEAEFQVYKYGHMYDDVEDYMTKRNKYLIGNSLTKHVASQIGGFQGRAILHESYIAHESITVVEKKFLKSRRKKYLESIIVYVLDGEHVKVSVYHGDDKKEETIKIDAQHVFQRHHFARLADQNE